MLLLAHESIADVEVAAQNLRRLGPQARKLLEDCVEHQELHRAKVSQAATKLTDAGFLFINDEGDLWKTDFKLRPSLAGEEALEMLELLEGKSQ